MRRALWIFSAPVVAGGLAWAVNAANTSGPLLAGAPQAQNGKVIYFSRAGKPAAAPSATDADETVVDDSAADDNSADADPTEAPAAPQRFVRNRPLAAATPAAANGVKNYKDLFANSDTTSGGSAVAKQS